MRLRPFVVLQLAGVLVAMVDSAGFQDALNSAVDGLVEGARASLAKNDWGSYFLSEINLDMIIVDGGGYPQLANFKANGGSLRDLTTVKRSGDALAKKNDGELQIVVPLDFGQLKARYTQYFYKFGFPTYLGAFTTTYNKTLASAILVLSGTKPSCNVTVAKATMEIFGSASTNIKVPKTLVDNVAKVEEAVAGAFYRGIPILEEFLLKSLKEAVGNSTDLCTFLQ